MTRPNTNSSAIPAGVLSLTDLGPVGVISGPTHPTMEQRVAELEATVHQLEPN
jgi:hypothetical protein